MKFLFKKLNLILLKNTLYCVIITCVGVETIQLSKNELLN